MTVAEIVGMLDGEIGRLQQARALLSGERNGTGGMRRELKDRAPARGVRKRRVLSPETKAKMAAAQQARWAKRKGSATSAA